MSTLLGLLRNPLTDEFSSTRYLKAGGEIFGLLVASSWVLTFIYNPSVIEKNPLKDRVGYNNVCVGFDTAPAKYVALFLWPLTTYFNLRFAWLEVVTECSLGDQHSSRTGKICTAVASALFAISVLFQPFMLVVAPVDKDSSWLHTGLFVQYILIRVVAVATQFFRNKYDADTSDYDSITTAQWTWFYAFVVASLGLPTLCLADFTYADYYRPEGDMEPLIPWYILNSCDLLWFFCLATTGKFLPCQRKFRAATIAKGVTTAEN